jgi:hypothetical protein
VTAIKGVGSYIFGMAQGQVLAGCKAEEAVDVNNSVDDGNPNAPEVRQALIAAAAVLSGIGNGYAMNIINPVVVRLSKELVMSAHTQSVTKISSILGKWRVDP